MTIQELKPEEYNKYALKLLNKINNSSNKVSKNNEDLVYLILYNYLMLNEIYINVILAVKYVDELVKESNKIW